MNKVYISNFNGVLDDVVEHYRGLGRLTENYHEADIFILWQDVRGDLKELSRIAKRQLKKPVLVVQHGRAATRDYCPPNNFDLLADKILVWGQSDVARLQAKGIKSDQIEVVGCPLFKQLKPRDKSRQGKNVLYAPVISEKEEPENILVYAELKKWESEQLKKSIYEKFKNMKRGWAVEDNHVRRVTLPDGSVEDRLWKRQIVPRLPRNITYSNGLINVKLTGVHDPSQYMSPQIGSNQGDARHVEALVEVLQNTDVMVCLEEGTMQLLACALDIPVIVVDIFKYGSYAGVTDYDRVEKVQTKACHWIKDLEKLGPTLDRVLANPGELRKNRIAICEEDGGAHLGDASANIIRAIESYLPSKEPAQV